MSAIYQRTVGLQYAKEVPDGWECPICNEGDVKMKGGAVFHEKAVNSLQQISDGADHPAHRDCVIDNFRYRDTCHSCRAPIDPSRVMTYAEWLPVALKKIPRKLWEQARAAYGVFERSGPWVKQGVGIGFVLVGLCNGYVFLVPIGTHCWSRGIHDEERIWGENARLMNELAAKARDWNGENQAEVAALVDALKGTGDGVAVQFAQGLKDPNQRSIREKASSLWYKGIEYRSWQLLYKGYKHVLNIVTATFTYHCFKKI